MVTKRDRARQSTPRPCQHAKGALVGIRRQPRRNARGVFGFSPLRRFLFVLIGTSPAKKPRAVSIALVARVGSPPTRHIARPVFGFAYRRDKLRQAFKPFNLKRYGIAFFLFRASIAREKGFELYCSFPKRKPHSFLILHQAPHHCEACQIGQGAPRSAPRPYRASYALPLVKNRAGAL